MNFCLLKLPDHTFSGGESGIRTHERIAPLRDFQSRLFGHSSISPYPIILQPAPSKGILAERVGFEPTSRENREPLFESGALSLSATSPLQGIFEFYPKSNAKTSYFKLLQSSITSYRHFGRAIVPLILIKRTNKVCPQHRSHLTNLKHKNFQL